MSFALAFAKLGTFVPRKTPVANDGIVSMFMQEEIDHPWKSKPPPEYWKESFCGEVREDGEPSRLSE